MMINFIFLLQLFSKSYPSAPVIFPLSSRSCGILGTSATIHRITENEEILSRIMPEECCWFATQSRYGISRISDNIVNCTALLDCSRNVKDKEWFCHNSTMIHPSETIRQRENYDSFIDEDKEETYVIIGPPRIDDRNKGNREEDETDNETRKAATIKNDEY